MVVVNVVVVGFGGYDSATANVVSQALADSLSWRFAIGVRPVSGSGFYLHGGYTPLTLGGGVSGEDLLSVATDQVAGDLGTANSYTVDSTLHLVDIEFGWRWKFLKSWVATLGIGFAATVASSTTVHPKFQPVPLAAEAVDTFSNQAGTYLDSMYQRYVFTPTISFGLGFNVF